MTDAPAIKLDYAGTACVEVEGFTVRACVKPDSDMGPPWEEHDGHGKVSDWRPLEGKRAGELALCKDRGRARFYDFADAVKTAKADGWDAPPYGEGTPGQRAERAARADFERMRDWVTDRWHWVGVVLEVERAGVVLGSASLWGIESDAGDYLNEVASELLPEALASARAALPQAVADLAGGLDASSVGEEIARIFEAVPELADALEDAAHKLGCVDAWRQALAPIVPAYADA